MNTVEVLYSVFCVLLGGNGWRCSKLGFCLSPCHAGMTTYLIIERGRELSRLQIDMEKVNIDNQWLGWYF